ncbi:CheR family methyltransferase [Hahella ganghwensis]|uniref:CheR family methyltransferase n=1 Tax=Hahella ganghwensis TaxID=286420 RepID=UPI000379CB40|nr:CheR family methyltransferase [Hahella ganghwensis]
MPCRTTDTSINEAELSVDELFRVQCRIETLLGLHFPRERWQDLTRHLQSATSDAGMESCREFVRELLKAPPNPRILQRLSRELTIGETYFKRDPQFWKHFSLHVLQPLIRQRREQGKQSLRFWSAGCSSGEEAYTLAILLHQHIPDPEAWEIRIEATDLDGHFLNLAREGVYRPWSFRQTSQQWKQNYFEPAGGHHLWKIKTTFTRWVRFSQINLITFADTPYLYSNFSAGPAFDAILCRNVLMYFSPQQAAKTLRSMRQRLSPRGILVLSAVESLIAQRSGFTTENWPGSVVVRDQLPEPTELPSIPIQASEKTTSSITKPCEPSVSTHKVSEAPSALHQIETAKALYSRQSYQESLDIAMNIYRNPSGLIQQTECAILITRCYANLKQWDEAERWARSITRINRLEPMAYWLLAIIDLDREQLPEALKWLDDLLYLQPDFILGHYFGGLINARLQRSSAARRHLRNCRNYLDQLSPDTQLPEGDGLTADDLLHLINQTLKDLPT